MGPGKDSYHTLGHRSRPFICWRILVSFTLLIGIALLSAYSEQTPPCFVPKADNRNFSAYRAYASLQSVYVMDEPHPTGSQAQKRIGDRLIAYLHRLGYTPEVQESMVASHTGNTCAIVRNIMFRLKGIQDDKGILVTAHYDSVPCGSGGMDDGVGVATILELARVLKNRPPPVRPVLFLLSDGEEIGLLGAKAFIEQHPWARTVQTVIGVDSGGDGGRSRLTQITGEEPLLIDIFTRRVRHPVGSSAISSVLDTFNLSEGASDFEEFRRAGKNGVNLINSAWNYRRHTSSDDIERISLGTLQDHGEHLLALINGFSRGKQNRHPSKSGKIIFFDLFGMAVIRYNWLIACFLQVCSLALLFMFLQRFVSPHPLPILKSLGKWLLMITGGAIGGGLAGYVLVKLPQMPFLLKPALLLVMAIGVEFYLFRHLQVDHWEPTGTWVIWNLLGVITCIWMPGVSYLFTIPAIIMGVTILASAQNDRKGSYPWAFGAAILLWLPLFYVLIEFGAPYYFLSIPILVTIELILPLLNETKTHSGAIALISFLTLIILVPIAIWMKPSEARPHDYANITYLCQPNLNQAFWILPIRSGERLMKAVGPVSYRKINNPLLRSWGKLPVAKAPLLKISPPVALLKSDSSIVGGKRRLVVYLQSPSKVRVMRAVIRPRPAWVRVNGLIMKSTPLKRFSVAQRDPWEEYQFVGKMTKGMTLEVILPSKQRLDLILVEQIDGLPSFGEKLLKARQANILPIQNGDLTLIAKIYHFKP